MFRSRLRYVLTIVATLLFCASVAQASGVGPQDQPQNTNGQVLTPQASVSPAITASDVGPWVDGFMSHALKSGAIPGAVVVIVKDGQVLFEKGYGFSDLAGKKPVDAKLTLFRPGSISKLFTWTAVMQLVESGKLDLDKDINIYLDLKIPPKSGRPVTLRNLLTHTAGFEEYIGGLISSDPKRMAPLATVMKAWTPARIFNADTTPAYSNYGAGLAGYIVQRASGQPFDDYVEQHILWPLDMHRSSFRQPLPAPLSKELSLGYPSADEPPQPFEFVSIAPAGALSATGDDMAHFMIAHLQEGRYGSAQILNPETAKQMHTSITRLMPPLNGIALGFYEQNLNGRHVLAHGGDTVLFHSDMWLFMDDGIGLYISMNSPGKPGAAGLLRQTLFESFTDRYLPGGTEAGSVNAEVAKRDARMIAGLYTPSRRSDSSFASLLNLFGQLSVTSNADGTVSVFKRKYIETSPLIWRQIGGHDRLTVIVSDGKVVRLGNDAYNFALVFEPTNPGTSAAWLPLADGLALGALVLTLLAWPFAAVVRWRYKAKFPLEGHRAQAYRLLRFDLIIITASAIAWMLVVAALGGSGLVGAGLLHVAQGLTLIGALGACLAFPYSAWTIWSSPAGWFARVWNAVLGVSVAVLFWTAIAFHLVGFGSHF